MLHFFFLLLLLIFFYQSLHSVWISGLKVSSFFPQSFLFDVLPAVSPLLDIFLQCLVAPPCFHPSEGIISMHRRLAGPVTASLKPQYPFFRHRCWAFKASVAVLCITLRGSPLLIVTLSCSVKVGVGRVVHISMEIWKYFIAHICSSKANTLKREPRSLIKYSNMQRFVGTVHAVNSSQLPRNVMNCKLC